MMSLQVKTNMAALVGMTGPQRDALRRLTQDSAWTSAEVTIDRFDLPRGWLFVNFNGGQHAAGGYTLGISPEGEAHS